MQGKMRTSLAVILVLALLTIVVPSPVLAAENKVYVTGTIQLLPSPPDLPQMTVEELGNGKVLVHDWSYNLDTVSDPRLSGYETMKSTIILNMNTGSGGWTGSSEIVNDGGCWSGHTVGRFDNWTMTWHATFVGRGVYKGLVANLDYSPSGTEGLYNITGYIVVGAAQ